MKKTPTLPSADSSVSEIVDFTQSVMGRSKRSAEKKFPGLPKTRHLSRYYKIRFNAAEVMLVFNLFDICDICFIDFKDSDISSECYDLCNERFSNANSHLWVDNDTMIEFYINQNGERVFRFCLKPLSMKKFKLA